MRYLRHRRDGTIYEWDEILAGNPLCEEVTEQEAFPEQFIPPAQKTRKTKMKLDTEDVPEAPAVVNEDLNLEASKGLPS
jgi:hypothetical protein